MAPRAHRRWARRRTRELPARRGRRRRPRRRPHDGARRDPHARVHARRDEGDRQVAPSRRGARARRRRRSRRTRTTSTSGPGEHVVEELGGIHAFSGWSGPILTDSGGFQVFSLRDTIAALDDDGVTFRSVYDGTDARFTPEGVAEIQRRLGSDIAMCLDVCLPAGAPARRARACRAPHDAAGPQRQVDAPRAPGSFASGSRRAATDAELRRRSIDEITALPFDGFALGGLAVGESKDEMLDCVEWAAPAAPGRRGPATSWASGIRKASSRSSRAGSTCSTACCRRERRERARRSRGRGGSTCATPRTARIRRPLDDELRVPGLRAVLARIHPPPRHAARDSRITAAQPA